jgi:hypothetical protein
VVPSVPWAVNMCRQPVPILVHGSPGRWSWGKPTGR